MEASNSYIVNSDIELKENFLAEKKAQNVNSNRKTAFHSKAYA